MNPLSENEHALPGLDPRPTLPESLNNIGLCFSGGGFRAAGFTLGCFAYLEKICINGKPLSKRVKFISSASGGSFASMAIVHAQRNGHDFEEAYHNLFECLESDVLLREVLAILKDNEIWEKERPDKERNPINGFAVAYDRMLFNKDCFGILWNKPPPGSVGEICVTTTDFTHGQQFRFQHDGTPGYTGRFGGGYLKIRTPTGGVNEEETRQRRWDVIKKIKLGDILAASSCFPAGFEPIIYPGDFSWNGDGNGLTMEELRDALTSSDKFVIPANPPRSSGREPEYGFMDGGIVDNQAIGAFNFAEERLISRQASEQEKALDAEEKEVLEKADEQDREAMIKHFDKKRSLLKGYGFDLLAICDVSSNYTQEIIYTKPDKSSWFLKLSVLHYALIDLFLFLLGVYFIYDNRYPGFAYFLAGATSLPILIASYNIFSYLFERLYHYLKGIETPPNPVTRLFGKHIWYFIRLPLYRLVSLIESRAMSVINLAVTLFLKKIRQDAYKGQMSESFSKTKLDLLMREAEAGQLITVENEQGFHELIENQKSWNVNMINPTVYLLSRRNESQLATSINRENWKKLNISVQPGNGPKPLAAVLNPSENVRKVADIAGDMATTLWFDQSDVKKQMRASLIACGQFTICHTLLRFSHRFEDSSPDWKQFQADLLHDWLKFQDDPYWLFNQIGTEIENGGRALKNFTYAKVR